MQSCMKRDKYGMRAAAIIAVTKIFKMIWQHMWLGLNNASLSTGWEGEDKVKQSQVEAWLTTEYPKTNPWFCKSFSMDKLHRGGYKATWVCPCSRPRVCKFRSVRSLNISQIALDNAWKRVGSNTVCKYVLRTLVSNRQKTKVPKQVRKK